MPPLCRRTFSATVCGDPRARAHARDFFLWDIHGLLTLLFELPIFKFETLALQFYVWFQVVLLMYTFYLFLKI